MMEDAEEKLRNDLKQMNKELETSNNVTVDAAIQILTRVQKRLDDEVMLTGDGDKAFKMGIDSLNNQKWIPCSERLPETNKSVQITFREYLKYSKEYHYGVCKAVYISEHSVKTCDMWTDCDDDELSIYDEVEDEYYVKSGWYEVIEHWDEYSNIRIYCEVTAWMPLPKLYKVKGE